MSIEKNQVKKVAKLSRISLDESKVESLSKDLNSIINFVEQLNKLDTKDTKPLSSVIDKTLEPRNDKVNDGQMKEEILKNSQKNEDLFIVPKRINMSDLNKSSISEIINLIKLKKISSLETNHFIKTSKKMKFNCFDATCFEKSIKSAKDFDAKKISAAWCTTEQIYFAQKIQKLLVVTLSNLFLHMNLL